MSDRKIIDFDPTKRVNKKDLDKLLEVLNAFDPKTLETVVVIFKNQGRTPGLYAYGLDWAALGASMTMLSELGKSLLIESFKED